MFHADYSNKAEHFLKKANKILAKRVIQKVEELCEKPVPPDAKTIEGVKELVYRVRVGDYRIFYEVDYSEQKVGIIKIDKRGRAYG